MRFRGGGVGHIYMRHIEPWLDETGWGKSWPSLEDREPEADPEQPSVNINCSGTEDPPTLSQSRQMGGNGNDDDDDNSNVSDDAIEVDGVEDDVENDPEQPEEDDYDSEEAGYEGEEEEKEDEEHTNALGDKAGEGDTDASDSEEEDHYL